MLARRTPIANLRWKLMAFLIFPITFIMSLDRTNIVVTAPIIQKQFNFSLVQMSLILTSFYWTYAFLQVAGGLLAERFGPRKTLGIANVWWSVFTVLTPFGFNVASFVGIRALLGAGEAADWPSSILAIKRWFPRSERAKGNSILLGGLYFGPIVAAPLTVAIVSSLGWQWAFYLYGLAGLVTAAVWFWWFRDNPREHSRIGTKEIAEIEADGVEPHNESSGVAWRRFVRSPQFWAIGLSYFFLLLIQSFYQTWLPTYLVKERGLSLATMGVFASLPWVGLFVMVFVTGSLADRVLRRTGSVYLARVPFAIAGFIVSALALIVASRSPNATVMIVFLVISLGAIGLTQVSVWSATQDLGTQYTGSVAGWTNCWGNAASALGPVFTALLVGLTANWTTALLVIAAAGLCGAILWLFIHPERPLVAPRETINIEMIVAATLPPTDSRSPLNT
jgi:ACS family glucarate transporter-like MFS transporter